MARSPAKVFLEKHMDQIIEKTRTPEKLADYLCGKDEIIKEMYSNILAKETTQAKMREIFKYLNNTVVYKCVHDWLKENEPHVIEDLENNSDTENGAPERKRSRRQTDEAMDDTDNVNTSTKNIINPDLKKLNTFAKLEEWVSDPQNNQSTIEKLRTKLSTGQMEDLERKLKDKKLKKFLCFNDNDVTNIYSNRSLKSYLTAKKDRTFPDKLTLSRFFEMNQGYASKDNDSSLEDNSESYINNNESTDVQQNDLSSSGYGSSFSSDIDQTQNTDGSLHTSVPFNQLQAENNDDIPLNNHMDMQKNVCEPNEPTSVVMKCQTEVQATISSEPGQSLPSLSGQEQPSFSSRHSNDSKERKDDRRKLLTQNKLKKLKDRDSMFKNWAMGKCRGNSEGGLERVLNCISIINIVEHCEYPFLVAEKVWVYKNPENDERKIIVFSNDKKISRRTETLANYQMFLCGIGEAVILGQEEKEIELDISKVPESVDQCLKFISEAFVPALAVFKNMQRKRIVLSSLRTVKDPNL